MKQQFRTKECDILEAVKAYSDLTLWLDLTDPDPLILRHIHATTGTYRRVSYVVDHIATITPTVTLART